MSGISVYVLSASTPSHFLFLRICPCYTTDFLSPINFSVIPGLPLSGYTKFEVDGPLVYTGFLETAYHCLSRSCFPQPLE